jgi:hypothetical protein
MQIKSIKPNTDFTLSIETEDGKTGIFNVKPYLQYEVFKALNNLEEFLKVKNRAYYIEWESGADLSHDTIANRASFKN